MANIKRVLTMYQRLPPIVQEWQPIKATETILSFPRSRSEIRGVPQGADHVRGFTVSGMFLDEAAFVDGLDETIAAVKPALGKTGKFTAISSSNPGTFKSLVFDT